MFFEELIFISKIENSSIIKIISKLIKDNSNNYDSIILIVKANINEKKWDRAKELELNAFIREIDYAIYHIEENIPFSF